VEKRRLDDGTVLVGFELPAAVSATSVSLVGDFNDWSPATHPLALLDDGRFRTELSLPAGRRFRFRYLLDGERWENDWAADDYVSNGLGADDSVVDLTALGSDVAAATTGARPGTTADPGPDAVTGGSGGSGGSDGSDVVTSAPPRKRRWWQRRNRHELTTA
jgi:hypothetical protein